MINENARISVFFSPQFAAPTLQGTSKVTTMDISKYSPLFHGHGWEYAEYGI
jgi:hypothetical protein